eukprot:5071861-Amphidinium_carterae.2
MDLTARIVDEWGPFPISLKPCKLGHAELGRRVGMSPSTTVDVYYMQNAYKLNALALTAALSATRSTAAPVQAASDHKLQGFESTSLLKKQVVTGSRFCTAEPERRTIMWRHVQHGFWRKAKNICSRKVAVARTPRGCQRLPFSRHKL